MNERHNYVSYTLYGVKWCGGLCGLIKHKSIQNNKNLYLFCFCRALDYDFYQEILFNTSF